MTDVRRAVIVRARIARKRLEPRLKRALIGRAAARVHPTADIALSVRVRTPIEVGSQTSIDSGCVLKGGQLVSIGRHSVIGRDVLFITSNHDVRAVNMHYGLAKAHGWKIPMTDKAPIDVGSGVWLGDRVIVLPGVTIGDGAVCAAGSVITRDVAAYAIVAGVPARRLRLRFDESVIRLLTELKWWLWDDARLTRNRSLFEADLADRTLEEVRALVRA